MAKDHNLKREGVPHMKIAIVGRRNIGSTLQRHLGDAGHHLCFPRREMDTGILFGQWLERERPQAVCLAISTRDTGEAELEYIQPSLDDGIPVITSAKGALAYHADKLKPRLKSIGFSATVGGGTMMLEYLRNRQLGNQPTTIEMVVNGTLNYIFYEMSGHKDWLLMTCHEMVRKGCTEPGEGTPLDIINRELLDAHKKIFVVLNTVLSKDQLMTPHELNPLQLTAQDLAQLGNREERYRFIVSFTNYETKCHQEFFGEPMVFCDIGGWYMNAGFRKVTVFEREWLPAGVNNGLQLSEGYNGCNGVYRLEGPGAGPEPTVSAMIADLKRLCKID